MTAEAKQCPRCGSAYAGGFYYECGSSESTGKWFDESIYCLRAQLSALTARVAELEGRLADIDAAANADAADLAEMRDGTKLTRAGLVQVIQYQQQDIKELEGERERLREACEIQRLALEEYADIKSWRCMSQHECSDANTCDFGEWQGGENGYIPARHALESALVALAPPEPQGK
jgi:hypothetical protein